jgi:macrolide-specific efflux system membrane fusion protein
MKPRTIKYASIISAAVLAAAVGAWKLRPDPVPEVATAPATVSDIEAVVLAVGTLEPARMVNVGAQVSGQIKSLKVQLGDRVTADDLIAEIDSTTQQNEVRDAKAALEAARAQRAMHSAQLKKQTLELERKRSLFEMDAGSRADVERAEADVEYTKAQIASMDAEIEQRITKLDTAVANLGYTQIRAPMDGVIVAVLVKEGQTVNAIQSAPTIVKIAQLDVMTVNAQVSEADVAKIRPGQDAYFTVLGDSGKRYYGTLRSIDPAPASIQTDDANIGGRSTDKSNTAVYYNAILEASNPHGDLRISMTAQVSIVLDQAKDAVTIPSVALGPKAPDGRYIVRVLNENRVQPRAVAVGIDNNMHAQVLDGLSPGDLVVIGDAPAGAAASRVM